METGTMIAGRYAVLEQAGSGGMGQVYRARDTASGRSVAVKIRGSFDPAHNERFLVEARTLSLLSHPAIVGYLGHGATDNGDAYIVMEWLDGLDLAARLRRGRCPVNDAIAIARRVAEGLAAAHAKGLIHRDIKPGNVMLAGGEAGRATLVDFGIARAEAATRALTRTGAIVGTAGYMAPEQIEGRRDIDARADVFSLGAVLYECLTGEPAFPGDHVVAVLARVLHGRLPRVSDSLPSVPAALDELVARWMSRDRELRPDGGAEALRELTALPAFTDDGPVSIAPRAGSALSDERNPISVVVAIPREIAFDPDATLLGDDVRAVIARAHEVARRWGGTSTSLGGGGALLAFSEGSGLRDLTTRAARAALELQGFAQGWALRLTVVRADTASVEEPSGVASLALQDSFTREHTGSGVVVDALAAALLDMSFEVDQSGADRVIRGYSPLRDEARPLLGRATPCVGREKELRLLEGTWDECVEERSPRAALLVAAQGIGKSRVRRELVARLTERGGCRVLTARCDVAGRSAPMSVLRAWIDEAAGLGVIESSEARWTALERYLVPVLARAGVPDARVVTDFVGEMVGAAPPEPSAAMRGARVEARQMRELLGSALAAWLRAETLEAPLLLVIEDLHWADTLSVALLGGAWASLSDRALFVVATAWPEVTTAHPGFEAMKGAMSVKLELLGARASERLVRQVLGASAPQATVERVVRMSGGNAFLLEEILRGVAQGASLDALPDTVLAVVQSRLRALPFTARRCLRAASVFGERFRERDVEVLLAGHESLDELRDALALLRREELVLAATDEARDEPGEWSFRHSLVRDAAYDSLTSADRLESHLKAGRWLATQPDAAAGLVADHLARGEARAEAAGWFLRATRFAERHGDIEAGIGFARRGQCDDADPDVLGRLYYYEGYGLLILGKLEECMGVFERVPWRRVPPTTDAWFLLRCAKLAMGAHLGQFDGVSALVAELRGAPRVPSASSEWGVSGGVLLVSLAHMGLVEEAREIDALLADTVASEATDLVFMAQRDHYRGCFQLASDSGRCLDTLRAALGWARESGAIVYELETQTVLPLVLVECGAIEEARETLRAVDRRAGTSVQAMHDWILVGRIWLAAFGDAPEDVSDLVKDFRVPDWIVTYGWGSMAALASAGLSRPDDVAANATAYESLLAIEGYATIFVSQRATFFALLAELANNAEHPEDALRHADDGRALSMCSTLITHTLLGYNRARALDALGRDDAAAQALAEAQARIERVAATFASDADRASWLAAPLTRRTMSARYGSV